MPVVRNADTSPPQIKKRSEVAVSREEAPPSATGTFRFACGGRGYLFLVRGLARCGDVWKEPNFLIQLRRSDEGRTEFKRRIRFQSLWAKNCLSDHEEEMIKLRRLPHFI